MTLAHGDKWASPAQQGAYEDDDLGAPLPNGQTWSQLLEADMQPIAYLNDPYIPEGLQLLAGRPKIGKTTLQRQKLAAVAEGGLLFGEQSVAAPCAYLSLEEGDRLARRKLESAGFSAKALANVTIFFRWRRGTDGAHDLRRLLKQRPDIRYIAIDSLTRFRSVPDARTPAFQADYEAVTELHGIAKSQPGLAIDLVHHTRKMKSDDPLDDISGTYGISAAVDSYWVMRHHEDGAVLHVGGRLWDREVSQFQLKRANQRWEMIGEFSDITTVQRATLDAIKSANGMSPQQGAQFWNVTRQSVMDRFNALLAKGLIYSKAGVYYIK